MPKVTFEEKKKLDSIPFHDWAYKIERQLNNVAFIVETENGNIFVLSRLNILGGVCDDCTDEQLRNSKLVSVQKMVIKKN